ncbi:MAG TPA: WYL domain-containing protein [Marmoricola sp.]|nr:WYL domain-containing protein [Marmoricola sp.]
MTSGKSERLLNLVILLLVSRSYVSKERIREVIEPYRGSSAEAFEKMFERDKDDLRALGIPVEMGHLDRFFEDEQGYRIRRDAFELPELDLAPDEAAVLGLAARVWQHAGMASATSDALVKLRAAGHEIDQEALSQVQPRLAVEEPAFDAMWQATVVRQQVEFDHRRPGDAHARRRRLQPWGVASVRDRWYVVGHDLDRGEPRSFRLSRIQGDVRLLGRRGAYDVPAGTDVRSLIARLVPERTPVRATLLARHGSAHGLRRRSTGVVEGVPGPDARTGWDRLEVAAPDVQGLCEEVLGYGDAVVVERPDTLRTRVLDRLDAVASLAVEGDR